MTSKLHAPRIQGDEIYPTTISQTWAGPVGRGIGQAC